MHVHLVGVCGTGMGALAGLFRALGYKVSGSDVNFDPPMGPALRSWGIELMLGFDPKHVESRPDVIVVGNVCRSDNVEARAALDSGLRVTDMAHGLADLALSKAVPLVVGGTHGKTTTTAMCAWLLDHAGCTPGFLIGGLPKNFDASFRPAGEVASAAELHGERLASSMQSRPPFVVEGDEYDTAFFEKTPKFWHYKPEVAIVSSIEHDHVDIYPTLDRYINAFSQFVARVPAHGLVVANAADHRVVQVVRAAARCDIAWYALQGDEMHGQEPTWIAAPSSVEATGQTFEVRRSGTSVGIFVLKSPGIHNVRNALAAVAATCQGFGISCDQARMGLQRFEGVRRRQDLIGTPGGVHVYDDFAHHPTAVNETLRALRSRHPTGSLIAVFEPRSATACRAMHQHEYSKAFGFADRVLIAPLGRSNVPPAERLDPDQLASDLRDQGLNALAAGGVEEIIQTLVREARNGDVVALLSNGSFGGIHSRLLERLSR